MSAHPVLDLGAAVRVLNDGQAWEIGLDRLDVDTYLAGGEAGGALLDLTPHLIEAQWVQGTGDAVNPDGVLPRGEAGTATLTLWDPTGEYMPPPADPFGGVRPGRRVVLYERDSARNPTTVLWAGWVEQLERETPPDGPTVTVITAVDSITKLVNSVPTPPDARSPESPYERAVWASDVLTPGLPALLDPAATAANVAGTQVGDSAWKTLVDAADVELGALFTLRDGTLVMLANSAGEFTSPWQATWQHGDRDALLPTAAWWVDAAYPTDTLDGLRDLSGQGRDALFGADDAAPRVLPWDGETYLHVPGTGQGAQITTTVALPWTATDRDGGTTTGVTPAGVWLFDPPGDWVDIRTDDGQYILNPATVTDDYTTIPNTGTAGGTWSIIRAATGYKTVVVDRAMLLFGAAQQAVAMIPGGIGDGTILFVARFWQNGTNARFLLGAANVNVGGVYAYQSANGLSAPIFCYVGADNSTRATIPSIGAYGQHVVGARLADTFDGLLDGAVVSTSPTLTEGARLLHDRVVVGALGATSFEFLGAAVFDRALTDTEIQQAAAELLSDYTGQTRVVDLGDRFQITVSPTPTTGTWTPPAVGDVLTVTRPQASEFHIHGTVLSSAPDGPYWTFTLTHTSFYWPGRPPPGTIISISRLDWTTDPPGTPQWTQPECAPARISTLTYDLASLRNDIHIRRRDTDSDLTPFTHLSNGESVGHYGRWTWQWDGSPHDDAAGEARAAALTLSAYALPRAVYAALEVNVTAAANTAHADTLLDLVRTVNLSNTITARADGRTALARVYGWDWTWTAAGGLSGQVTLGRPPGAPTPGMWFVGVAGMSELDETTILA